MANAYAKREVLLVIVAQQSRISFDGTCVTENGSGLKLVTKETNDLSLAAMLLIVPIRRPELVFMT